MYVCVCVCVCVCIMMCGKILELTKQGITYKAYTVFEIFTLLIKIFLWVF